jgi:hypothetical protein
MADTTASQSRDDVAPEPFEPPEIFDPEVFKKLPQATRDTFAKSLLISENGEERLAAVLYAPDLQFIGVVDNKSSDASSSYSKSVTEGFDTTYSVEISAQHTAECNFFVAKGSLTVGVALTFTSQHNKSTTETINFEVPARKSAYLYQGFLRTKIIRHDLKARTYGWAPEGEGRFLTNLIATSDKPEAGTAVLTSQR